MERDQCPCSEIEDERMCPVSLKAMMPGDDSVYTCWNNCETRSRLTIPWILSILIVVIIYRYFKEAESVSFQLSQFPITTRHVFVKAMENFSKEKWFHLIWQMIKMLSTRFISKQIPSDSRKAKNETRWHSYAVTFSKDAISLSSWHFQ